MMSWSLPFDHLMILLLGRKTGMPVFGVPAGMSFWSKLVMVH
jgi:hypothetical protein